MKYLKDLNINQLYKDELIDYTMMNGVDLDKEIEDILNVGVKKLYEKYVPRTRRDVIDFKIRNQKNK